MENIKEYKVIENGGVTSPKGYKASGVRGGIKKDTKDVAVIASEVPASAAGAFTTNKFAAAPVAVTKENIENGCLQAIVVNSGNANACTGKEGLFNAWEMARITAEELGIQQGDVAVASTGVIGVSLDMDKMEKAIKLASSGVAYGGGCDAAEAIMTTDTFRKEIAIEFEIGGEKVRIGAMSKGSGMIHPNMATMLCFVTSDTDIDRALLKEAVKSIVEDTFNMVTIDGDTSTNDMVIVLANGMAKNKRISRKDDDYYKFYNALYYVLEKLSIMMAKDGEGATKLITMKVLNAVTKEDGKKAAKAVVQSSLVKTAVFGEDANWGRIMAAIGYSNAQFDAAKVDIYLESDKGSIKVAESGEGIPFSEEKAKEILGSKEITIVADLNDGQYSVTAWGCDLTYDYVKINGSYRS